MELKDVFTALESIENGTEMIAAIKMETTRLSNEAKRHRMANESAGAKTKSLLEALGLDDGDDVIEQAKSLKDMLNSFVQGEVNDIYTFDGVETVKVYSIETGVYFAFLHEKIV